MVRDRADYLLKKLIDEAYKEGSHKPLTRMSLRILILYLRMNPKLSHHGDQNIERRIRSLN